MSFLEPFAMDKSWLHLDRTSVAYKKGVTDFLGLAFSNVPHSNQIRCPCKLCRNILYKTRDEIELHLLKNGMDETYTTWTLHGENINPNTDVGSQRHASVPRTEPPFELGLFDSIEGNQHGGFVTLSSQDLKEAHYYVLSNCDEMPSWIEQHKEELRSVSRRNLEKQHKESFGKWFQKQEIAVNDARPSHARRPQNGSRRARGVVKGYAVIKRIRDNENDKLSLSFSKRLGGDVGVNRRAFIDEVGVQVRQHVPIVGIEKWGQVSDTPKQIMKKKILDNKANETKIMKVANERYRTWRSTLAATYRSYNTDEERLRNLPEELKIDKWKELMRYFSSDKFQNVSRVNSENRKKQKVKHTCGSKSYSQISYEMRDEDTGEEPNELELWHKTHTKNDGEWASETAKEIYENVSREIAEKENELGDSLPSENVDEVFQSVVGTKLGYVRGRGYKAKVSKAVAIEELQSQVTVQAKENNLLNKRVEELENALDVERALAAQRLEETKQSMRQEFLFLLTQYSSQKTSSDGSTGGGGFFHSLLNSGRDVLDAPFNN